MLIFVGRRGYDNWLVYMGLKMNISVIDATKTLTALHQTGSDGNKAGFQYSDRDYNMNILEPFDFILGW